LTLGQITQYIEEVYSSTACFLSLELDQTAISELQLDININSLRARLEALPKTPIKNVEIGTSNTNLRIYPAGKSNAIF
jgi:hypothetical protein